LAELCVFEAFLDLGAVVVKVLDPTGLLVVDCAKRSYV